MAQNTFPVFSFAKAKTFFELELDSLSTWTNLSNFFLNLKKSHELTIHNNYNNITPPSLHPSLEQISFLTILGVSFTETFNITPHVDNIITKSFLLRGCTGLREDALIIKDEGPNTEP